MKLFLFGTGKMGKAVEAVALRRGHLLVSFAEAELCIDFSHPDAAIDHLREAGEAKKNIVMGTTSWYSEMESAKQIVDKSGIGFLYAPNFSIGVRLFSQLVRRAALLLAEGYQASIIETHHSEKVDAPSGTAKMLEEIIGSELEIQSIREGDNRGRHEVIFDSLGDTITLTHQAKSRDAFALGAVLSAEWLVRKKGFFTLDDMIEDLL